MFKKILRFCFCAFALCVGVMPALAFDVVSGGGEALVSQSNINNSTKVLLGDLLLTTNTAVTSQTVIITIPAGTSTLEFSTDPVAITSSGGTFTVNNLNQTASQIDFEITGSGTLSVANIGVYTTNPGTPASENRNLNINFQASNFAGSQFQVDTNNFALGFGGGVQLNAAHNASTVALGVDDLILVASTALTSETVTITFDDGAAFTTQATGTLSLASGGDTIGTTALATLDDFADGDVITVSNTTGGDFTFAVTATNTVDDFQVFLDGVTNLGATFDDPNDEMDLTADEDLTITSDGAMSDLILNFTEAAALEFVAMPNLLVTSGSLTVANPSFSATQIQFDLTGTGRLELQNLQIFATNLAEKGAFFETRYLNINALATDFSADLLVVDTTDYGAQVSLSGATGGSSNNIFKIGDTLGLSFAPLDYSTRFSEVAVDLSAFGGNSVADFNDTFSVVSDDDDGAFIVPLTVAYTGTNVEATYNTLNVNLDNQPPGYDFTGHNIVALPTGKTVGGINDLLTISFPTESTGDSTFFTADFSDIAGTIANFVDRPVAQTQIALQEVVVDNPTYTKTITISDDAGNTIGPFTTNQVSVDLIRPILATANVLSIQGAPVPGVIGDLVDIALPVDTGGDTITYDLDLSALGGSAANFSAQTAAQTFAITAGALNDAAFNQTLTIYDEALNSVSATTNSLQIDNAVPTFDTSCGGTFTVNDSGLVDTNSIADVTNGEFDGITFLFPDSGAPGCDIDNFTVDLSAISQSGGAIFTNQNADGTTRTFALPEGNFDRPDLQFPLTIWDTNGNQENFLTGTLKVDNNLTEASQLTDLSTVLTNTTPNGVVLPGAQILVNLKISEDDIINVSAEIQGVASIVTLSKNSSDLWTGTLVVEPGALDFSPKFIQYGIVDDAGNVITLEGDKAFYITNDTREQEGGGGGSLNFSNITKKSTLQRFTPSQTKEFHDKNTALKQKSKAQLRLESLRRRMTYPPGTPSRIVHKPESLIDQQREAWAARQAARAKDGQPQKMQYALERLVLPKEDPEDIAAARDDAGEFRLRSTLDNLKSAAKSLIKPVSRRQIAPNYRGKYVEIKR